MDGAPESSYKFYRNTDCAYFPCHDVSDINRFNCLFCYCPLYFLGDRCGGNYKLAGSNGSVKDCSECTFPHEPENYDAVIKKITDNINQF